MYHTINSKKFMEIDEEVLSDIVAFALISKEQKEELEFSLFAIGKPLDEGIYVDRYYFPRQINSSVETKFAEEEQEKFMQYLNKLRMNDPKFQYCGWFHSHTFSMNAFFSGTDETQIETNNSLFRNNSDLLAADIVFAFKDKKSEVEIDMQFAYFEPTAFTKQRAYVIDENTYTYTIEKPSKERIKRLKETWKKKVIKKVPKPVTTFTHKPVTAVPSYQLTYPKYDYFDYIEMYSQDDEVVEKVLEEFEIFATCYTSIEDLKDLIKQLERIYNENNRESFELY
ncbi:MAG: hypothetical protein ACE5ES_00185 [Candidatus Nanoarchaeia archaeon]